MSDEKEERCTETLYVRVQPSLLKRTAAVARRMAIGSSTLARIALVEYLEKNERDDLPRSGT
jgi:hypothetical protein